MGEKLRSSAGRLHPALSRAGRFRVIREDLEIREVVTHEGSVRRRYAVVRNPSEARHEHELSNAGQTDPTVGPKLLRSQRNTKMRLCLAPGLGRDHAAPPQPSDHRQTKGAT